jgi:Ferritin-like
MNLPDYRHRTLKEDIEARKLLVDLLHEAAQLEHCLLISYLYTACSLRSTPPEFTSIAGKVNIRRAIQFERVRAWKESMLRVAVEEMLHLHYVECMLRALGESPSFTLPKRDSDSGNWIIPNWKAQIGHGPMYDKDGVEILLEQLTPRNIRHFVLYEAADSLQNDDPFGQKVSSLFDRLHKFEMDLHFENMFFNIEDATYREELKTKLNQVYTALTPLTPDEKMDIHAIATSVRSVQLPPLENLRFQSIADFYYKGILPLYEQAFDFDWVKYPNLDLINEQLNPDYAREGFLPVGPVYRTKNFQALTESNIAEPLDKAADPLSNYKHIGDIVQEIVDEGEGASNFEDRAEALLTKVEELGGAREYLNALLKDKNPGSIKPTPDWLAHGELLRQSHLYRFAMVMTEFNHERVLAQKSGVDFEPSRQPITIDLYGGLKKLAEELVFQFNACYLVLIAWLSRMYEIPQWIADKPRRLAIEMLASWPMMSLAIRPFLELASFFPVNSKQLFRLESDALPLLPIHAQQLYQIYANQERSEQLDKRMDYLAIHVLSDAASWAANQIAIISDLDLPASVKKMILARLSSLTRLDEFQKQFPFRIAGGYSNRMPDLTYQQSQTDSTKFEEDPTTSAPLYQDTLALRLRFSGWSLVQMATDPDPPTDEVGCTGTHMLHAADGDRRFDRALVWQVIDPDYNIIRVPEKDLPIIGVNCVDVSLLVTDGKADAGYVPLQRMQSARPIQTSDVQQNLEIQGFLDLLTLTSKEILGENGKIRINLLEKNGIKPYLNGENHLLWQDGEPIDPFILGVLADTASNINGGTKPEMLFQREVFNEEISLLQMSPMQRLLSARQPCGFDNFRNIPEWAKSNLSNRERNLLNSQDYPKSYLINRAKTLTDYLFNQIQLSDNSQEGVDAIASLSERLRLVSVPRSTTESWLRILLHYGHTISGRLKISKGVDNRIFSAFAERTHIQIGLNDDANERNMSNSRWLVKYTMGVMDTDALSDFVYGEVYVPVIFKTIDQPLELIRSWTFPANMKTSLYEYACSFDKPFWAPFEVKGDKRILKLPSCTVVEYLQKPQENDSYSYTMTGIKDINEYKGTFALIDLSSSKQIRLEWRVSFKCDNPQAVINMLTLIARDSKNMTALMGDHFSPHMN